MDQNAEENKAREPKAVDELKPIEAAKILKDVFKKSDWKLDIQEEEIYCKDNGTAD